MSKHYLKEEEARILAIIIVGLLAIQRLLMFANGKSWEY